MLRNTVQAVNGAPTQMNVRRIQDKFKFKKQTQIESGNTCSEDFCWNCLRQSSEMESYCDTDIEKGCWQ